MKTLLLILVTSFVTLTSAHATTNMVCTAQDKDGKLTYVLTLTHGDGVSGHLVSISLADAEKKHSRELKHHLVSHYIAVGKPGNTIRNYEEAAYSPKRSAWLKVRTPEQDPAAETIEVEVKGVVSEVGFKNPKTEVAFSCSTDIM